MQEIIIDIELDGRIKIEGKGFEGADCKRATAAIEEALGTVEAVKAKPEYHRQARVTKKVGA